MIKIAAYFGNALSPAHIERMAKSKADGDNVLPRNPAYFHPRDMEPVSLVLADPTLLNFTAILEAYEAKGIPVEVFVETPVDPTPVVDFGVPTPEPAPVVRRTKR